jgi:hypothetical protein
VTDEDFGDDGGQDDDYLAQARRAAGRPATRKRSSNLLVSDDEVERSGFPIWLTVPMVLLGLLIVAAIVWFYVLPMVRGAASKRHGARARSKVKRTVSQRADGSPTAGSAAPDAWTAIFAHTRGCRNRIS